MLLLVIASLLLWDTTPSGSAPIPWELVDMTYVFDETTLNWPTMKKFEMKVTMNQTTADGYWLQLEEYSSAIHAGTHMDAPCHFALGKWCVDDIPLERLGGPAAVVDITDKAAADPDATVEIEDLREWESLSGRSLNGTIVVMRSGWGRRWGDREAFIGSLGNDTDNMHFPGMSPKAAQWLVDNRDVHGVASESLSVDKGQSKDFMSHRILYGSNIYGLENVANVEEIPIVGAYLHVMPMKIGRGSGAPTRIVAKYPKVHFKPKDGKSVTERSLREVIIFSKLQLEEYSSPTHAGTHMDAPCHFARGKWCVDDIPLDRLAGPAAVVDITDKAAADPDAGVEIEDLQAWESLSGRSLNGTIVIMRSGWGRKWGDREAYIGTAGNDTDSLHFPGMSPKAAQWLVDNRDVHGVASDSLTISRGQSKDFMAHRILLGNNVYGLENVANVEDIPIVGAFLHVMPMKIGRGSGAPTRIIARYPKVHFKPKDGKSVTERSVKEVIIFSK